jgi:hypothetical protein
MDVYKLLHEDHLKVKSLFRELEDTTERAVKTREHLFANLKTELTLHAEAEERFFYPRLEPVKTLLTEHDSDDKGTEQWAAKLTVLKENVEHHVKEEEEELFKKAKKVLSSEDAESIAEEIEAYKEEYSELEEQD